MRFGKTPPGRRPFAAPTPPLPMSSLAYVLLGVATLVVLVPFILSIRNNAKGADRD